ncbi:hypothetical protein [Magnetospirillum aberrantis]|uniref:Uncharacterized protein n=1 Tax=Magnetospirillum aberrantis SpK TaxID=908842 RepID=A0A7C9QRX1_9PROT|nr:hypothetical protein [Magnetospirillum aberrantis]NFV79002.1 hypothetical protein [Magnetospirillum aberrantis SpK]
MVSGTYWVWDGAAFVARPIDRHHHDSYELLDGEIEQPDLDALAACMAINPACHTILAPDFASWGDGTDGPRKWEGGWSGTYFRPINTAVVGLCGGYHEEILAHELCHSIAREPLWDALADDDQADTALTAWLAELGQWPEPPQLADDPEQWEIAEERLCYSYDSWHGGREQPHGLALPRGVERIFRGIKSGKVCRRYMS